MNEKLKEICSKCENYIHCQGKGCAWRSLSNEYCDEVENVNKLINDLQQENKQLKDNWNMLKEKLIIYFNITQDTKFLDVLEVMQELEKGDSNE